VQRGGRHRFHSGRTLLFPGTVSGYAASMGNTGPDGVPEKAALLVLAILAFVTWGAKRFQWKVASLVIAGTMALTYVIYKSGFVRQDAGHEAGAISGLGLMLILLGAWMRSRLGVAAFLIGLFALARSLTLQSPSDIPRIMLHDAVEQFRGSVRFVLDAPALADDYARAVSRVARLPWHPVGTADIYSSDQSRILASGLHWVPRPVLQSYSAYTPALERLNAAHVISPRGADNIFFRPEPVDNRLPALEDGASWPALLGLYHPVGFDMASDLLWLRRHPTPGSVAHPGPPLLDAKRSLGSLIELPDAPALWVELREQPTIAGAVVGAVYKLPSMTISLHLADGGAQTFRFIPAMAETGFLLSPLITSAAAFLHLRPEENSHTRSYSRRVTAFSLQVDPADQWAWQRKFRLSVSPIAFSAAPALPVAPQSAPVPIDPPAVTQRFTCFLDELDGSLAPRSQVTAYGMVFLKGWGAFDAQAGIGADRAQFAFVSASGAAWAVPVTIVRQDGIGDHFGHAGLLNVGMLAQADTSRLPAGAYRGEFVFEHSGQRVACATVLKIIVPS
jgi:hypothetical protein